MPIVEFSFESLKTIIQCQENELMKDILNKFASKNGIKFSDL